MCGLPYRFGKKKDIFLNLKFIDPSDLQRHYCNKTEVVKS